MLFKWTRFLSGCVHSEVCLFCFVFRYVCEWCYCNYSVSLSWMLNRWIWWRWCWLRCIKTNRSIFNRRTRVLCITWKEWYLSGEFILKISSCVLKEVDITLKVFSLDWKGNCNKNKILNFFFYISDYLTLHQCGCDWLKNDR